MAEKFIDPLENNEKPFEIPEPLMNSLSECAPEGWLLFYIDSHGQPQTRAFFLHQITEMGLRSYATKFLKSINNLEENGMSETMRQENEEFGEEEE